jgi:hypothetical protein
MRGAAVGTPLCVAAAATLVSVGWGLKDQGLYCVALVLVTLTAARWLAEDDVAPRPATVPASRSV